MERGDQTKALILKEAKDLFMKKGFTAVSMSDLCEATGLSRGGLYRHYSSTDEIFSALLNEEKENMEEKLEQAFSEKVPASLMLAGFFEKEKKEILEGAGKLSLAIYEYERSGKDKHRFLVNRYHEAVRMMEQLFKYGQERGEVGRFDAYLEAEHLVIFLEGLRLAGTAISLPEDTISEQLTVQLKRLTTV